MLLFWMLVHLIVTLYHASKGSILRGCKTFSQTYEEIMNFMRVLGYKRLKILFPKVFFKGKRFFKHNIYRDEILVDYALNYNIYLFIRNYALNT